MPITLYEGDGCGGEMRHSSTSNILHFSRSDRFCTLYTPKK